MYDETHKAYKLVSVSNVNPKRPSRHQQTRKRKKHIQETVPNVSNSLELLFCSIRFVDRAFNDLDIHKHDNYLIYEPWGKNKNMEHMKCRMGHVLSCNTFEYQTCPSESKVLQKASLGLNFCIRFSFFA